ncbi:MAG: NUDIX domain-containing protein [Corynebacterium sp.]|uniref:NUDIX hydrolase n=1 Tax=Corynebacterium sp. TaxID=1720 RepID=UPI0026DC7892|nr:NUDIX domain-containing protein [Corynebacterium sp.]MDO4761163.1 NUDIX domain-containing protein [Corynebacterium sp.]
MQQSSYDHVVVVSAVLLIDAAGRILTVRKQGTQRFMLPGGKLEPGESPKQAALRETQEEIGVDLDPEQLEFMGEFLADAANESGWGVKAYVFWHRGIPEFRLNNEIAQSRILDPNDPLPDDLAPLLEDVLLPALGAST